jgi:hypothetical protein
MSLFYEYVFILMYIRKQHIASTCDFINIITQDMSMLRKLTSCLSFGDRVSLGWPQIPGLSDPSDSASATVPD